MLRGLGRCGFFFLRKSATRNSRSESKKPFPRHRDMNCDYAQWFNPVPRLVPARRTHRGTDRPQKIYPLIADRLHSSDTDIINARNGEYNQRSINYTGYCKCYAAVTLPSAISSVKWVKYDNWWSMISFTPYDIEHNQPIYEIYEYFILDNVRITDDDASNGRK